MFCVSGGVERHPRLLPTLPALVTRRRPSTPSSTTVDRPWTCRVAANGYEPFVTNFGYTLMTEQSGPKDLVRWAVRAEQAGFDFEVSSDHYSPWLTEQGHAPYAWSVLGAVAQATERVELMTYVTCPTMRYHPAVIAQKSATMQLLADGRFTLGLGSGESLNEHVVGEGWPGVGDAAGHARRGHRDHPQAALG